MHRAPRLAPGSVRGLATLLAAVALGAAAPARLAAQTGVPPADTGSAADRRAVLGVVERLFAAMRTKDTAAFRAVFEPGARLVGMRRRPDGTTVVQSLPWERFAALAASDGRGPWVERAFAPEVRVRGPLAQVWAMYDFHFGDRFSHCGVDAVQLLRGPDGWRIVSIADTYETEGCPPRPAPAP